MKTKGRPEVRAVCDTRIGRGDRIVPAGTIGCVIGQREDSWAVWWKDLGDDWHGIHPIADLELTDRVFSK